MIAVRGEDQELLPMFWEFFLPFLPQPTTIIHLIATVAAMGMQLDREPLAMVVWTGV